MEKNSQKCYNFIQSLQKSTSLGFDRAHKHLSVTTVALAHAQVRPQTPDKPSPKPEFHTHPHLPEKKEKMQSEHQGTKYQPGDMDATLLLLLTSRAAYLCRYSLFHLLDENNGTSAHLPYFASTPLMLAIFFCVCRRHTPTAFALQQE